VDASAILLPMVEVVVEEVVVEETSNRLSDNAARRGSAMSIASLTTSAGFIS
jgi:hypothetical protein